MSSIKKNSILNLVGSIIPMAVGLVTIPILLKSIGVEKFGILSLIWALIGYFSVFDFGIGRALTQGVSKGLVDKTNLELYNLIRVGLRVTLITGLAGGILMAGLSHSLSFYWLNSSPNLHNELFLSILLTAIGIPFVTYTSGLRGVLEGFEDFKNINLIKIILGILNFIFPIISVFLFGNSLLYIAISLVSIRVIVFFWHLYYLNKVIALSKIYNAEKLNTKKTIYEIYKFGSWMTLSNLLSSLMVNADRFVLSFILGASVIAYYTVPFDLSFRALIIPAAYSTTLFPRFSSLIISNSEVAVTLYNFSKKKMLIGMTLICILMVLFSYNGLSIWISADFAEKSWIYLCIISVGIFFNGLSQVPYAFLQAFGKVKLTALIHTIEFIIYILILIVLINLFGIIGAAYAFTIRVIIDYILMSVNTKKIINKLILT